MVAPAKLWSQVLQVADDAPRPCPANAESCKPHKPVPAEIAESRAQELQAYRMSPIIPARLQARFRIWGEALYAWAWAELQDIDILEGPCRFGPELFPPNPDTSTTHEAPDADVAEPLEQRANGGRIGSQLDSPSDAGKK